MFSHLNKLTDFFHQIVLQNSGFFSVYQIICLNPINNLSYKPSQSYLGLRLLGPFLGIALKMCCVFASPCCFIGSLLNFANASSLGMNSYFPLTSLRKYSLVFVIGCFCSLLLRLFFYINNLYCSKRIDLEIKKPHINDSSDLSSGFQGQISPLSHRSCKGFFFFPFCGSCLWDPELYRQQQGLTLLVCKGPAKSHSLQMRDVLNLIFKLP